MEPGVIIKKLPKKVVKILHFGQIILAKHNSKPTLRIGAKLGWFVIVDTRPTQADISRKIVSSWPQSTR